MPRRLLAVNVVLVGASLLCVGLIVKQMIGSRPAASPRARPSPAAPAAPAASGESPRLPAQAYGVIATRNLFSPTRTETPGTGGTGGPAIAVVKPSLHGVVLRDGAPIAYLEDPLTKRIAGYRIGDPIAGGTVQTISADAVVINRPDGPPVDVRLRDPSKPRPAIPPAAGQPLAPGQTVAPGQALAPGQQPVPGQQPGVIQPQPGGPVPTPGVVGPTPRPFIPPQSLGQPAPGVPFTRPAPSLGRRLPPVPVEQPQPQPQQPER